MTARTRLPCRLSLVVMIALGCSRSDDGDGCGSTAICDIDLDATACGDLITLRCFDNAVPDAASQCELALQESDQAIYCCTSAVETNGGGGAGVGGGGGAGGI